MKITSAPPSLMKSLMAGFDVVSNHVSLIVFSVLLDLLFWFGPQVRVAKLFEPIFQQSASMPEMQDAGAVELLRAGAERLNLVTILRTFPVGIPSLMAGRFPVATPLIAQPLEVHLTSFWKAVGIWGLLIFLGIAFGTLYFSMVAQASLMDQLSFRKALRVWPRNFAQVLLLTVFWYGLISIFLLPLSCLLSVLLFVGIGVGQFPLLIALFFGGIIVWLLIPLFFSPHGIFAFQRSMWESMIQGIRLSRATFSTTGLLILSIVILSEGLNVLWNIPKDDSWFMLIGITGHAFITAVLLAATFVFYRDADLWLKDLLSNKESDQAG